MEIVYVLTNPAMPGFVKIGKTSGDDVNARLAQLYTTGVPFPFELRFACRIPNSSEVEKALHIAFAPYRVNAKREFFSIEPEQAIAILKLLHVEEATVEIESMPSHISAEEIQAATQYKARRPNLNFKEMGLPIGSMLKFTEGESVVTVVSEKLVRLGDDDVSLTAATRTLLGLDYSVNPTRYWTYEGILLNKIYNETYRLSQ